MSQVTSRSRRSFLNIGAGAAAAIGLSDLVARQARAATRARAVVCIYLLGGNDSNNMIVPLDSPAYDAYARARGALAIPRNDLLPLQSAGSASYGFHPNLPALRDLYNQNTLAVLANVGRTAAAGAVPPEYLLHSNMQVRFVSSGYLAIPWATTGKVRTLVHGSTMALDSRSQTAKGGTSVLRAGTLWGALPCRFREDGLECDWLPPSPRYAMVDFRIRRC